MLGTRPSLFKTALVISGMWTVVEETRPNSKTRIILGGGAFQKSGRACAAHSLKPFTLAQIKICVFPYPISDLTQNLIPYLTSPGTALVCIEIWEGLQLFDNNQNTLRVNDVLVKWRGCTRFALIDNFYPPDRVRPSEDLTTLTVDPRHAWTETATRDPSLQINKLLSVT